MSTLSIENDSAEIDYDKAALMFPYAFIPPGEGINFLESIIYLLLYITVHHKKRLDKLNAPVVENIEYSAEFFKRLVNASHDHIFIECFSGLVIDSLKQVVSEEYLKLEEKVLKDYFLTDKFLERKDIRRAARNKNSFKSEEKLFSSDKYL